MAAGEGGTGLEERVRMSRWGLCSALFGSIGSACCVGLAVVDAWAFGWEVFFFRFWFGEGGDVCRVMYGTREIMGVEGGGLVQASMAWMMGIDLPFWKGGDWECLFHPARRIYILWRRRYIEEASRLGDVYP